MADSRIGFALADKIFVSLGLMLALFVAIVTFIFDQSRTFNVLFYPLMPGLITHLVITGFHGGTATQEAIAPWIPSIVNGGFYFGLVIIARIIWKKLVSRPTAYKRIS